MFSREIEVSKVLLAEAVKRAKQDADIIANAVGQRVLCIDKVSFEREYDEELIDRGIDYLECNKLQPSGMFVNLHNQNMII